MLAALEYAAADTNERVIALPSSGGGCSSTRTSPTGSSLSLEEAGHDAVHVSSVGLDDTDDDAIFPWADREDRVGITADADFSEMLATGEDPPLEDAPLGGHGASRTGGSDVTDAVAS